MSSGEVKVGQKLDRFVDECKMAISGIVLATRRGEFWATFLISFAIFGTLMNLLASGFGVFNTMFALGANGALRILGEAFLETFGVGKAFGDWALMFTIVLLQSILIGLIVLVWRGKRRQKEPVAEKAKNASNVQDAGIATGLAILGTGCPTCGTSLLAPVLGSFISSGSYLIAGVISWGLTVVALVLILVSLKRVGKDAYAMIVSERFLQKRKEQNAENNGKK